MFNNTHLPAYNVVFYANDPQTGYYTKTIEQPEKTSVMRLPYRLKVEPTQLCQIKCNALQIIRGKETFKSGGFKFFTGLQPTNFLHWYTGYEYENLQSENLLSLCFFKFSKDNNRLTVFYCVRLYEKKQEVRERFTNDVIPVLNHRLLLQNTNGEF